MDGFHVLYDSRYDPTVQQGVRDMTDEKETDIGYYPVRRSATLGALFTSLSAAQAEFPPIEKSADNPYFKSKYADLGAIVKVIGPIVAKHGLSVTQLVCGRDLVTIVGHKSGEWIESRVPLDFAPGVKWQERGTAITYARRYTYASALSLALVGEDDDGNEDAKQRDEAVAPKVQTRRPVPPKPSIGPKTVPPKDETPRQAINRLLMFWGATTDLETGTIIPNSADQVIKWVKDIREICGVAPNGKLSDEDCAKVLKAVDGQCENWPSPDDWLEAMRAMAQPGGRK